jgi:hypothetical protein
MPTPKSTSTAIPLSIRPPALRPPASAVDPPFEPLLTISEVAAVLRRTKKQTYELTRRARHGSRALPSFRVGKSLLFKLSEIYRWLDEQRERRAA